MTDLTIEIDTLLKMHPPKGPTEQKCLWPTVTSFRPWVPLLGQCNSSAFPHDLTSRPGSPLIHVEYLLFGKWCRFELHGSYSSIVLHSAYVVTES
jgi:hypothetical protein